MISGWTPGIKSCTSDIGVRKLWNTDGILEESLDNLLVKGAIFNDDNIIKLKFIKDFEIVVSWLHMLFAKKQILWIHLFCSVTDFS